MCFACQLVYCPSGKGRVLDRCLFRESVMKSLLAIANILLASSFVVPVSAAKADPFTENGSTRSAAT
jgi:hypothetical protein